VAGTGAKLATRLNLPALGQVAAKARDVFVIDFFDVIGAKAADLPAGTEASATATTAAASAALRSIAAGVTIGASGAKATAAKAGRAALVAVGPRCRATAALLIFVVIAH